ncbi:uncharacterized protein LOC105286243 isoform X1 [Ooceraea biroi]|uniref:uncharacterized protein LOC105286243 isoform X1 n=1 Tax=Ooceraea biroi TaxID=2015173 RepID=UPI000F0993A6|nr:uncharacterized protein LOC105286243 isoform X1 [Ooceraea biroi]XP_026825474.1 uncharacterized protein LOC105286243 isoform X1 [Ooceraea biroi]
MKRRIWDKQTNKYTSQFTDNFIVTIRGTTLKDKITIFENLHIMLRVRPYVEPVVQCYNCFMFGRIKAHCKRAVKCIICGNKAHGVCNDRLNCIDCGGEHKSTDRSCPVFQKNKELKVIMAHNNISFIDAEKLVFGGKHDESSMRYDRYTNLNAWPVLGLSKRNKRSIQEEKSDSVRKTRIVNYNNRFDRRNTINERENVRHRKERDSVEKRRQEFLGYNKRFNGREEEISKDRFGLLLQQNDISNTSDKNYNTERRENYVESHEGYNWVMDIENIISSLKDTSRE